MKRIIITIADGFHWKYIVTTGILTNIIKYEIEVNFILPLSLKQANLEKQIQQLQEFA